MAASFLRGNRAKIASTDCHVPSTQSADLALPGLLLESHLVAHLSRQLRISHYSNIYIRPAVTSHFCWVGFDATERQTAVSPDTWWCALHQISFSSISTRTLCPIHLHSNTRMHIHSTTTHQYKNIIKINDIALISWHLMRRITSETLGRFRFRLNRCPDRLAPKRLCTERFKAYRSAFVPALCACKQKRYDETS